MLFLCECKVTEMCGGILLEADIAIFQITATNHASTAVISFLFTCTHMVLRVLILILIAASPEPRASHAELVRRSCLFG
jgi:hypothetical protein